MATDTGRWGGGDGCGWPQGIINSTTPQALSQGRRQARGAGPAPAAPGGAAPPPATAPPRWLNMFSRNTCTSIWHSAENHRGACCRAKASAAPPAARHNRRLGSGFKVAAMQEMWKEGRAGLLFLLQAELVRFIQIQSDPCAAAASGPLTRSASPCTCSGGGGGGRGRRAAVRAPCCVRHAHAGSMQARAAGQAAGRQAAGRQAGAGCSAGTHSTTLQCACFST